MNDLIVGIDLGTTNSEIAAFVDGRVRVLGPEDNKMLPSCVGISPDGQLLVGEPARNQQLIYPDRTVRSVKRKMGSMENVALGEKTFTPQEISALVLRELAERARRELGQPVKRAVITVPAYFSDAQRNATREAGMIAGLVLFFPIGFCSPFASATPGSPACAGASVETGLALPVSGESVEGRGWAWEPVSGEVG